MTALVHGLLLLLAVPSILQMTGVTILVVCYLFAVNIAFGTAFWRHRPGILFGLRGAAVLYLASGVLFCHYLLFEIDRHMPAPQAASARMQTPETPRPGTYRDRWELAGGPATTAELAERARRMNRLDGRYWWDSYLAFAGTWLRRE